MEFSLSVKLLIFLPIITQQRSGLDSPSYIGAVVEYSPVTQSTDSKSVATINADNYLKIIDKASSYAVDILVFPESSLSISESDDRVGAASYIPGPEENIVPCDDNSRLYEYSIKSISCAAKENQMYIVVNHREKFDCAGEKCPADKKLIYNSNVVFDRNGTVIARYRKYNLFGESGTNITELPLPSTFTTDFGVTFGQFICFDILFQTPTLNLTQDLGVTDIVYSAHWFSELPYFYSVETQAAWAYANDVNLLASGYNNPETASGGSGIYIGKQGLAKAIFEDKKSNILLVSEIPKVINGKRSLEINNEKIQTYEFKKGEISTSETTGEGKYLHKIEDIESYITELIDLKQSTHTKTVCDKDLCCEFNLNIKFDENIIKDNATYYRYRFSVFNGVRTFDHVAKGGIKSCGIISCTNETFDSCGHLLVSDKNYVAPVTFEKIEVKIKNISNQNIFFMPITFSTNILPLNASDFNYATMKMDQTAFHHMQLIKPTSELLTFAIHGRNFDADGSSSTILVSPLFLIVLFAASMYAK